MSDKVLLSSPLITEQPLGEFRLCYKVKEQIYVLQRAYRWTNGLNSGINWVDLPTQLEK